MEGGEERGTDKLEMRGTQDLTPPLFLLNPASLAPARVTEHVHHMDSSVLAQQCLSLSAHTLTHTRGKHIHKDVEANGDPA